MPCVLAAGLATKVATGAVRSTTTVAAVAPAAEGLLVAASEIIFTLSKGARVPSLQESAVTEYW